MELTEEMKKSLPLITEEELKELRCTTEELTKIALENFDKGANEIDILVP